MKYLLAMTAATILMLVPTLAMAQSNGYNLTVHITAHQFGNAAATIAITTANGYRQSTDVSISGGATASFNIPPNQGPSVQVCVTNSGLINGIIGGNCQTFNANGGDITVNMVAG